MLHETGEVGYGLKSLLLLQSSLPALCAMLPTSQPSGAHCLGWCLQDRGLHLILGIFPSAGLNCLPVLEKGQGPPRLGI